MRYCDVIRTVEETISAGGKLSKDVPPGTLQSIRRQAGLT